jgi:hypothetical protein
MKRKNWYPNDHLPRKIDLEIILKIENEKKKMKRKNWYLNDHLPRKIDLGIILKIENEKNKSISKRSLTKKNRSWNHPKDRKRKE